MNKRMKDPKGDLRFVHKLDQPKRFWVLKLTAMVCYRQAWRVSNFFQDHRYPFSFILTSIFFYIYSKVQPFQGCCCHYHSSFSLGFT